MIAQNYFPLINDGHTMRLAGQIDDSRLYVHPANIKLSGVSLFPVFDFGLPIDNYYGEYLVLVVGEDLLDATIDFNIIISLN
jgi:hypothetical protein